MRIKMQNFLQKTETSIKILRSWWNFLLQYQIFPTKIFFGCALATPKILIKTFAFIFEKINFCTMRSLKNIFTSYTRFTTKANKLAVYMHAIAREGFATATTNLLSCTKSNDKHTIAYSWYKDCRINAPGLRPFLMRLGLLTRVDVVGGVQKVRSH